ncbi:MAG: glucose/galactose MFS transporter [Lysobacterales bacterium 69-70]|nr:sugar MFS transporter [Xanthomonadaceae bacterium]ODU30829.1 MAG: glucose/galactose MFS transporter [Xanthomonadaceae bacterium SCN 69-320]ODV22157.1 MAG: glucose/galactose MFS transporter [Xanthomonadaceae bacterium SCN 69-25]OJY98418.1 MAG: glucose/galactose MFS transporter [Xanthomonadales bacterium 69-70]
MSSTSTAGNSAQYRSSLAIIGTLFFIFGFVTWINGPLIGFVKLAFDLDTDAKAFLVTFAFYMAYFFLALPSSLILERTGMKKGMSLGLGVMAVGAVIFGTFATVRNYPACLTGLFVIGSGLSLLQTASNPYISILGPIESAAARISIMGICNKLAGILSPIVMGVLVMKDVGHFEAQVAAAATPEIKQALLAEFAAKIYWPYMVMAGVLALLAVWVLRSSLPEIKSAEANATDAGSSGSRRSVLQFPHLLLGVLCIFVYVGVEVLAADAIGTYGKGFGIPSEQTTYFTAFTLAGMLVGYLIGLATIPTWLSQQRGLAISAVLGIVFSLAAYFTKGYVSVGFVAALGLANALMWPAIFPLAIAGLGRFTEKGSALLIMGIAGGALIPRLFAVYKDVYDFQLVFLAIAAPCYLYILFYSLKGYAAGRNSAAAPLAAAGG